MGDGDAEAFDDVGGNRGAGIDGERLHEMRSDLGRLAAKPEILPVIGRHR